MVIYRFIPIAAAMALFLFSGCISLPKYAFVDPATVVASNVEVEMEAWIYQKENLKDGFYSVNGAEAKKLEAFVTFNQNYLTVNWKKEDGSTDYWTLSDKSDLSASYLQQKSLQITHVEALCFYEVKKKGRIETGEIPFEIIVTLKDNEGETFKVVWKPDWYGGFERR